MNENSVGSPFLVILIGSEQALPAVTANFLLVPLP